jgi:hypothetical protein
VRSSRNVSYSFVFGLAPPVTHCSRVAVQPTWLGTPATLVLPRDQPQISKPTWFVPNCQMPLHQPPCFLPGAEQPSSEWWGSEHNHKLRHLKMALTAPGSGEPAGAWAHFGGTIASRDQHYLNTQPGPSLQVLTTRVQTVSTAHAKAMEGRHHITTPPAWHMAAALYC